MSKKTENQEPQMNVRTYYSQNGEDCILWALFENQSTPGFFVEVGALDGMRFSNTYSFEQAGWSGVCIEAHPDYISPLRRNRPNAVVVHAAVGDEDKETVSFYANSRGSFSTLDPSLENEFRKYGKYFTGWEIKQVRLCTLNTILSQAHAPVPIDIVSVDIEGTEINVLQGFDIDKYRPRVLVIEALDNLRERELDVHMTRTGYIRARKLSSNIFYCREEADAQIIANASTHFPLTHTQHPCDLVQSPAHTSLPETSQGPYHFSNNWFSIHEEHWQRHLIPWAKNKGMIHILEIGAYEGRSACWMLDNLMHHPESRLTCIDMWVSQPDKPWSSDMEGVFETFKKNIAITGKSEQVTILKGDSKEILEEMSGQLFDLIYIDADHSTKGAYLDTMLAFSLLKPGGITIWDDYFGSADAQVKKGVDRICKELGITLQRFGNQVCYIHPNIIPQAPAERPRHDIRQLVNNPSCDVIGNQSDSTRAEDLVAQMDVLMAEEEPFTDIFKDFVLKDDTDFVINGARFPLSQHCLHALARLLQPNSYLEIGTRYGYSLGAVVHGSKSLERTVSVDILDYSAQVIKNIESIRHVPNLEVICASSTEFDTKELFDFVYVDGNHTFAMALHDMQKYWKNVKEGGIMLIDDTVNQRCDGVLYTEDQLGVLKAVKEFTATIKDIDSVVFQYPSYSGFCVIVKAGEETSASEPSVLKPEYSAAEPHQDISTVTPISQIIQSTPPEFSESASLHDIRQFASNPENLFLISFPRTGSHWLRMIMELYFGRPTLTRIFYKHNNRDYLVLHDHDMKFQIQRENVIYLYREPVSTVFSQLNYYREDENNPERIKYWAEEYGKHLFKWLSEEKFTRNKIVIRYEELRGNTVGVLEKLARYYNVPFDEARAQEAVSQVSRQTVKLKTEWHNPRVQDVSSDYEQRRESFQEKYSQLVKQTVSHNREELSSAFEDDRDEETTQAVPDVQPITKPAATPSAKIVGLIAAKNEERIIEQCLRALSPLTDAIVLFDDVSEDDTVKIAESLADECNVEKIIRNEQWDYNEHNYRSRLLEAGREIGGTHFIAIDADEMFTANLSEADRLRKTILGLGPQEQLALAWIQLWRNTHFYRFDTSVWTNNYKPFIFCDDGDSKYDEVEFHLGRTPDHRWKTRIMSGYEYGMMHFQFANWRNLLVKQAWYRCLERIKHPEKSAQQINQLYAPSKDEDDIALRIAPKEWFKAYDFFNSQPFDLPARWREKQVLEWFEEHGRDYFADLEIWDIDWGKGLEDAKQEEITTDTGKPLVSAIVSTYNSERFIRGCLEDLEAQTIANQIEIIVVDSGSQQNERDIVEEFQRCYDNIVYISTEEREGVYAAWNRGIKAAQGKYITNANTDDRHKSDAFEQMVNVLDTMPNFALVYANVYITETENEMFESHTRAGTYRWKNFNSLELINGCFIGPQPMWRKSMHDKYGYFDETFESAGDWEFWLRIAEGEKFIHLDEFMGLYLKSPTSVEHRNQELSKQEAIRVHQRYLPRAARLKTEQAIHANERAKQWGTEGRDQEAIQELLRATQLAPKWGEPWNNLAVLFWNHQDVGKAMQYLRRGLKVDPENIDLVINYALMLNEAGEQQQVIQVLEEYHQKHPDKDEVRQLLVEFSAS